MESVARKRKKRSPKTDAARRREYEKRRARSQREHIEFPKEKHCNGCDRTLVASEFYVVRRSTHGLSDRCRECTRRYQKQRYARDPRNSIKMSRDYLEKQRRQQLEFEAGRSDVPSTKVVREMKQYGLTIEMFLEMEKAQGGKCAVCGCAPSEVQGHRSTRLYIDHCHETGVIRGLLCNRCNTGIGYFQNSGERLESAANYLRRTGASHAEESNSVSLFFNVSVCG